MPAFGAGIRAFFMEMTGVIPVALKRPSSQCFYVAGREPYNICTTFEILKILNSVSNWIIVDRVQVIVNLDGNRCVLVA